MIKIRYRDPNELSPGLHAAAERHGRSTTVYLLPGLSAEQRRSALRRLRISARRGYDPKLPAGQLAVALLADRIRTSVGRAGAVFRSHPAGSTVPVMVVSAGAIAFLALSAVSIRVIHNGPVSAGPAASVTPGPGPGRSAGPIAAGLGDPPGQGGSATGQRGQPGSGSGNGNGPGAGQPGNGAQAGTGTGAGGTGQGGTGQGADPGGGTTLTGGQAPTPTPAGGPGGTAPGTSSSAAGPGTSATTSKPPPTPTASKSGTCVNVGSLGLCV
jgi:hypothetical protein